MIILFNQWVLIEWASLNNKRLSKLKLEQIMKMNHVGIMVGNMDKAVEFYTKVLGLRKWQVKSIVCVLKVGPTVEAGPPHWTDYNS